MRLEIKLEQIDEVWRPWFAWFPVSAESGRGHCRWVIVWLETVERKQAIGYGGAHWRYRERVSSNVE